MEWTYYIPPGVYQLKSSIFFYLKNFHRQFRLCEILAVAGGQVCSGPAKPAGVGLRACLRIVDIFWWNKFFFCVWFFPCVFTAFFCFVFTNVVVRSFCLVHFCILLHVWIYVLHNHLFINLFVGVISMFVCAFTCLPYFFLSYLVMLNWVF